VPAVRQLLTFGEIRKHKLEKDLLSEAGEGSSTATTPNMQSTALVQSTSLHG
jgi:hypothetical protein